MDPQDTTTAITESSKAVSKLADIVNTFFKPSVIRRQAKAEAFAINTVSQTIRDNSDMEIILKDGKINISKESVSALVYRAEQRRLTEAYRHEENLENVLKIAGEELQTVDYVSDEPVNEDWLARFFQISQDIGLEDMQAIWGKILADEIKRPGSFSFRTLETIKNLDRKDAEIFQRILPLIMSDNECFYAINDLKLLGIYGISYNDILLLDDCRLINSDFNVTRDSWVSNMNDTTIYTEEKYLRIKRTGSTIEKISIGAFLLTRAGQELFKVLDYSCDDEFLVDAAKFIFERNKAVKPIIIIYDMKSGCQQTIIS